jgi:RNA ligase (TIGR02306 family)
VVSTERPEFAFLAGDNLNKKTSRIKAKRLRGVFSMGLLIPFPAGANPVMGEDWAGALGIVKYEEPEPMQHGEAEKDPGIMPKYTDIESIRRYPDIFLAEEQVIITEKIHGANGRWLWDGERGWAGSHHMIKKPGAGMWWEVADFMDRLKEAPGIVFYGEVYGQVQDLKYGMKNAGQRSVRFFDAFDISKGRFLDWSEFEQHCLKLELPMVPVIYTGFYSPALLKRAEEDSILCPGQLKEGFVIRPVYERYDRRVGRVIMKYHSERYLTRKGGTEGH